MEIALANATKTYGKTRALDGVDVTLRPGEITAIVGFNGAGKSTVLAALATAAGLQSGDVLLGGKPLHREDSKARRQLFWLPDAPFLSVQQTPLTNIAIYLDAYGVSPAIPDLEKRVLAQLDALHLDGVAAKPVSAASRGQRYKTALAALFLIDPAVWLLDEPFAAGLDAPATNLLRREMTAAARDRGRTVAYSTQLPELTAPLADRVVIIRHGCVAHDLAPLPAADALAELVGDPQ